MFSATRLQAATYLLGVCLFSIAFLVFINSSISFVITTLINQTTDVGDAVGSLGFADELVVLLACPAWGVVSDRLGIRTVCALGYAIIGLALLLFVQAKNVYPQLLLARMFFSVGAAAVSTMVTALLPSMITRSGKVDSADASPIWPSTRNNHQVSPSISSELTITPKLIHNQSSTPNSTTESSPTRLAGIVGLFTGCGALLSLGLFLRLPELIQRTGIGAGQALTDSYYIVGVLSLTLALICYIGLRHLNGEDGKGWRVLVYGSRETESHRTPKAVFGLNSLWESIALGFNSPLLGMGYLGGFVARASSVGISLFIPLFVNAFYISSGRCDEIGRNPQDVKENCRGAYVLAAELTGASQLVALIFAPVFGFLADRYRRFNLPLLLAALAGVLGYVGLATLKSPMTQAKGEEGTPLIFLVMALLGISQIGAIVCSLGLLGRFVLALEIENRSIKSGSTQVSTDFQDGSANSSDLSTSGNDLYPEISEANTEDTPLLPSTSSTRDHLKGSIAGVYSLAGGIGILILTKAGGLMFDKVSPVAPFYLLAAFNGILLVAGTSLGISDRWRGS